MRVREVFPGLFERTDTPRDVQVTRKFAEDIKRTTGSGSLGRIIEETIRRQEQQKTRQK
jgi:hypothetical protein